MEYVYATLLLDEAGEEISETNLTAVLEAANVGPSESRAKAVVAALEGVDLGDVTDSGAVAGAVEAGAPAAPDGADDGEAVAAPESSADPEEPEGVDDAPDSGADDAPGPDEERGIELDGETDGPESAGGPATGSGPE